MASPLAPFADWIFGLFALAAATVVVYFRGRSEGRRRKAAEDNEKFRKKLQEGQDEVDGIDPDADRADLIDRLRENDGRW